MIFTNWYTSFSPPYGILSKCLVKAPIFLGILQQISAQVARISVMKWRLDGWRWSIRTLLWSIHRSVYSEHSYSVVQWWSCSSLEERYMPVCLSPIQRNRRFSVLVSVYLLSIYLHIAVVALPANAFIYDDYSLACIFCYPPCLGKCYDMKTGYD